MGHVNFEALRMASAKGINKLPGTFFFSQICPHVRGCQHVRTWGARALYKREGFLCRTTHSATHDVSKYTIPSQGAPHGFRCANEMPLKLAFLLSRRQPQRTNTKRDRNLCMMSLFTMLTNHVHRMPRTEN